MSLAVWWVRRDLRLDDNPALRAALVGGGQVLPLFIIDPQLLDSTSPPRQAFLMQGLQRLGEDLQSRGSRLVLRRGKPLDCLRRVLQESGASAIYAEEDHTPFARRRDDEIERHLPLKRVLGLTMHHPAAILKADGTPYTVFTPFSRAWKALPLPTGQPMPAPQHLPAPPELESDPLPQQQAAHFPAGEVEARRRLDSFLSVAVYDYHDQRNRLDMDGTSVLSPYLRFGMLSVRRAAAALQQAAQKAVDIEAQRGCDTWLNELIWREFYHAVLYHFPEVLKEAFTANLRNIPWRDDPAGLAAWQEGRTGYPVVDACMRQLAALNWMHNRGRMIVASFLSKDLLIDWRAGERWFMQHLLDGDPASNNGGWQWSAGVGTDAAPYFRIFNPVLQAKKFDPKGDFVRRWVPELENVPDQYIHTPWLMPESAQRASGCRLNRDYPLPILEHSEARRRTLAAYQHSKALSMQRPSPNL